MSEWRRAVTALKPVSLEDVVERAEFLTRVDRKYLVTGRQVVEAFLSLGEEPRVLEIDSRRFFSYESVYYDTPDLAIYRDAARRRPNRFKVRERRYIDTGDRAIEVKARSARDATVKYRRWLGGSIPADRTLSSEALEFLGGFARVAPLLDELGPSLVTRYARVTLLTEGGRVTVDWDVSAQDMGGSGMDYGDRLILETKSQNRAGPLDKALWGLRVRPARVSKYCTSLATLRPGLPVNAWSRTLRRCEGIRTYARSRSPGSERRRQAAP